MELVAGGLYVFARLTGLLMSMPVLSAAGVPPWARLGFALPLTLLLLPASGTTPMPTTLSVLLGAVLLEALLGLLVGFVMQVVYAALGMAAEIAATQSGLAMAAILDPVSATQVGAVGVLVTWLGAGVFLGADVHLYLLRVLGDSFQAVPPGQVSSLAGAAVLAPLFGTAISTGVELAGPLTLFVFLMNVAISVIGRMTPGQQLFFAIGTTLQTTLGIALLGISLPLLLRAWLAYLTQGLDAAVYVLRVAGG